MSISDHPAVEIIWQDSQQETEQWQEKKHAETEQVELTVRSVGIAFRVTQEAVWLTLSEAPYAYDHPLVIPRRSVVSVRFL